AVAWTDGTVPELAEIAVDEPAGRAVDLAGVLHVAGLRLRHAHLVLVVGRSRSAASPVVASTLGATDCAFDDRALTAWNEHGAAAAVVRRAGLSRHEQRQHLLHARVGKPN